MTHPSLATAQHIPRKQATEVARQCQIDSNEEGDGWRYEPVPTARVDKYAIAVFDGDGELCGFM